MPFELALGSFPEGTTVYAIPLRTLEPVSGWPPPVGPIVGVGVAGRWGSVVFESLFGAGEGPSDQLGSSLLRCVAVANASPTNPRIVCYPRLTMALQMQLDAGTLPAPPWAVTPAPGLHDDPEPAAAAAPSPESWEPTVTYEPHTVALPAEGPHATRRIIRAPDRRPTRESGPPRPDHQPTLQSAPSVLARDARLEARVQAARAPEQVPEPPPAWWGRTIVAPARVPTKESGPPRPDHQPTAMSAPAIPAPKLEALVPAARAPEQGPHATRRWIAPDRTPTWQSSAEILRKHGRPKGTPPPPAYHGHPEPTP